MNQIICTSNVNVEIPDKRNESFLSIKKKKIFRFSFYLLISISLSLTIYYIFYRYDIYKSEKISKKILRDYNITSIYSISNNYSTNLVSREIPLENFQEISSYVLGTIEIKKINIVYPILSETNKNFLKISPCRFYGPNPNEIGNICIAAHNYKNETFFSNLSNLVNGDIITIYDSSGNYVDYVVYKVYTANDTDIECINQNTNGKRFVTLVTCDSMDNHYRTIVKAKEL